MNGEASAHERIVRVIGPVDDFCESDHACSFIPKGALTLAQLNALAKEMGTDAINLTPRIPGSPGYSDVTPGYDEEPARIEILR